MRIGLRTVQVNADSKANSVYVFSKTQRLPSNNTDPHWFPGKYDKETWVKYSNLDGEFTKVRKAMPDDRPSYRHEPTLTNY